MTHRGLAHGRLGRRAERLAELLGLDENTPEEWGKGTRPAMVEHQLAAPLGFDLRGLAMTDSERDAMRVAVSRAAAHGIESFGGLILHPQPPTELLTLAKTFFKQRTRECRKGSAEWEVAYLFYLLSIAAARSKTSEVSRLAPAELLKGIHWTLDQPWVADDIRRLLLSTALRQRAELLTGAKPR